MSGAAAANSLQATMDSSGAAPIVQYEANLKATSSRK
jgi:hypothetical protein